MWWKHYGFKENPLDIRPNKLILGLEKQLNEILSSIENGEIFLVFGPIGSGKTSLAYKVMDLLKEKYTIIYLNGEENPNPDLSKLIEKSQTIFSLGPIKIKRNKKVILILDEAQSYDQSVFSKIKYYYDSGRVFSVFLIQVQPDLNTTPSFSNRIYKKIEINFPDIYTIKEIINKRLQGKIKIEDEIVEDLAKLNNFNVRSILIELSNILSQISHPISTLKRKYLYNTKEDTEDYSEEPIELSISPQQSKILEKLIGRELTIKQIAELTSLPYNTVSKQVSRLFEKNILRKKEINGRVVYYINRNYYSIIVKKIGK